MKFEFFNNPKCEVYLIQRDVIKFAIDLHIYGFLLVLWFNTTLNSRYIAEMLVKFLLNTHKHIYIKCIKALTTPKPIYIKR